MMFTITKKAVRHSRQFRYLIVDVTKETTTLYASDRDVFVFLVDDTNHDRSGAVGGWITGLVFPRLLLLDQRGRQQDAWYCQLFSPRGLHEPQGVENFEQFSIRHSKCAAHRFAHEAALTSFANSSPTPFVAGIKAARQRIVARTDEDRESFLRKNGFSKSETSKVIETVLGEENHKPESNARAAAGLSKQVRCPDGWGRWRSAALRRRCERRGHSPSAPGTS